MSDSALTINDVIQTMRQFRAQHNAYPSSVKMSKLTIDFLTKDLPMVNHPQPWATINGVLLITDESIPFGRLKIIPPKN